MVSNSACLISAAQRSNSMLNILCFVLGFELCETSERRRLMFRGFVVKRSVVTTRESVTTAPHITRDASLICAWNLAGCVIWTFRYSGSWQCLSAQGQRSSSTDQRSVFLSFVCVHLEKQRGLGHETCFGYITYRSGRYIIFHSYNMKSQIIHLWQKYYCQNVPLERITCNQISGLP